MTDRLDHPEPTAIRGLFPGYQVLEEAGRGGLGVVYRARRTQLGQAVALKILHPELAHDRGFLARFEREAEAIAALDHPFLVGILERGEVEGVHYLVLEWCDGGTLRGLVQGDRDARRRGLRILGQVCEALGYAHRRGIVHRDLKPENVLLDAHGYPRVADFGLASPEGVAGTRLTMRGDVLGTPHYMAPEQLAGDPVSPATDVYAMGVMVYELLTGTLPVGRFRAPSEIAGALRHDLDALVLAALDVDPRRRPGLDALREALDDDAPGAAVPAMARAPTDRSAAPLSGRSFLVRLSSDGLIGAALLLPFGWLEVVDDRSRNLVSWGWQTTVDLFGSHPMPLWAFLPVFVLDALLWCAARFAGTAVRPRAAVYAAGLVAAVLLLPVAVTSVAGFGTVVDPGSGATLHGWSGPGFFALFLGLVGVVVTTWTAHDELRRHARQRMLTALRRTRRLTVARRAEQRQRGDS